MENNVKRTPLVLSIIFLAVAASCAKAPPPAPAHDAKADETAIRATTDTYLKAFDAGDLKGMAANTMEDAVEMREDGPELVGKSAIMAEAAKSFADTTMSQTATVDEVAVWGDIGMSRGTWQVIETPKNGKGKAVTNHGKWIVIHKRAADGSWNTWRHMWNQDRSEAAKTK